MPSLCDRRLPVCSQCISGGIQCNYPESNKRGFPPGYIAALERRLLETELALFDALKDLHLMHVSSHEDPTSEDDLMAREQQANLKINKSLTKHSANQSKTEKVAEWEALPLISREHHFEWWKDRLAMAGPPGEALLQRLNNIHSPQSVAAMAFFAGIGGPSGSSNARRFPYLAGEGSHHSQGGSYRSPSGSNDGSMTETTMLMMPPPPRPSMVSWASGQSSESTGYSSMQTSPQAQQPSPSESVTANQLPAPYAWPESMAQQQSEMNMAMPQSGGNATADSSMSMTAHTSSSNSSAQRLSSSQWRKFF
ncbi:hypothetical protein B0A52_05295 [Exophiala mesophila]|uniref:Zn(2)-C6 fungal-type domain-containing protein n=1 Tax=Exophiala mesophila TaxID=212818 RepID=A0A438N4G4_EXOME|nr:hypothetical protein B0A52_05295 [Exophiala mesophila]